MKFRLLLLLGFLALMANALAGPYGDLSKKLTTTNASELRKTLQASALASTDSQISDFLADQSSDAASVAQIKAYVQLRADVEQQNVAPTTSTPIKSITSSPLYRHAAEDKGRNWLGKAIDRIRIDGPKPIQPSLPTPVAPGGIEAFTYVVIGILGLAILGCLIYFIGKFAVSRSERVRRTVSLVDDDEPDRTLDEWLALAAQLEAEGRFREAVRCLYVACLLKFDEYRVLRFDRTETNWEHHRKLMRSPKNLGDIDFTTPTRDFDRIWYGNAATGSADVAKFRELYQTLTTRLEQATRGAA